MRRTVLVSLTTLLLPLTLCLPGRLSQHTHALELPLFSFTDGISFEVPLETIDPSGTNEILMSNPLDDTAIGGAFEPPTTAQEKKLRSDLLLACLPACQPQEGSAPNTFTESELQELSAAMNISGSIRPRTQPQNGKKLDICGPWAAPQEPPVTAIPHVVTGNALDWHGAPKLDPAEVQVPRDFRKLVREGRFTGPTNAQCPGFLQCNLVVLPQGQVSFDFLLFCQRNPKSCPLIDVCDVGSPTPTIAPTADLRTDCPKYAIYRNGKLDKEVTDVTGVWPENSVAFLIGCSFSYDGALMDADIPLRSAEQGKNVPMYKTNLKCRSAGSLQGNMVVSMKPISALKVAKEVEVTSKFPHAHGGPVCIGRPDVIGIPDMDKPDWGDTVDLQPDEVPVFHACGVTPQSVLMDSKVPFAITHAAGHMFVTDLPSDMGVV